MRPSQHQADASRRESSTARTARQVLVAFILTFIIARITVLLIMLRALPDLYLHLGGTHIHHLNYGIFLLAGIGAYLLFRRPAGRRLSASAAAYGIGLALTFDEFGMWLHLGGDYWQRASFDAIVVIVAVLALLAFAPSLRHVRPQQWATGIVLLLALVAFGLLLERSLAHTHKLVGPKLHSIEATAPE